MTTYDYQKLKPVAAWLYITAAAVFLMAIIGAVTRLTESGLSMVEWRPLIGALPPMNDGEWQRVFNLYKDTSEYQMAHSWMGLADFKKIFFWEWFHRLWGRMIGLIYAVPFFIFLIRGQLPKDLHLKFWGLLLLGGLQGLMGWYMVQSGFVDRTDVSHYRLAAHLGLAFIIFGALLRMAMTVSLPHLKNSPLLRTRMLRPVFGGLLLAFITIIWGAFVAGANAGLIYNEFPFMGSGLFPSEGTALDPLLLNMFENHAAIQFIHRWLAIGTVLYITWLWALGRGMDVSKRANKARTTVLCLAWLQAGLGISTLLTQVWMPLAIMHQAGALLVFGGLVWLLHGVKGKSDVSIPA